MGLGLIKGCGVVTVEDPNVQVEQMPVVHGTREIVVTTCHTPVGDVSEKLDMTITPPNPWRTEYMIKDVSDYELVKFILEDTVYQPNYKLFLWWDRHLGDDGIVRTSCGYTPFQDLLIRFMGYHL